MLRLLREGERLSLPAPQEDDGSSEFSPSIPSLKLSSSILDSTEAESLRRQLQAELTSALIQSQSGEQSTSQVARGERVDRVTLRQVPLPTDERTRLEEQLGMRLAELLGEQAKSQADLTRVFASTCVSTTPGDGLSLAPVRDVLAKPHPELDPNLPMSILVLPPSGDVLIMDVFPWPAPVLPLDQVQVGLGSAVDWAKQVVGWTICPPQRHQSVQTDGKSNIGYMEVRRADGLNAIVFRKPKAFGIWFDIFYFDLPEFIDVLGGRYAGFTWYRD